MKEEIRKFFKGDIEDTDDVLRTYSHDASLFEIKPTAVLFPKDSLDIQNLVKWVNENKSRYPNLSITPRSAGTCMSGGPLNTSLILDCMRYMGGVQSVVRTSPVIMLPKFPGSKPVTITGEAVVLPGTYYRDFEVKTLEQGLLLPCYTASKSINALGGMVGNNSAGELTLRYGKTEDYVKELKVVFADGYEYIVKPLTRRELYAKIALSTFEGSVYKELFNLIQDNETVIKTARPNVTKNSAGYTLWNVFSRGATEADDVFDLTQLIVGSQGTLGIVTEITFRLVDKLPKSKLLVIFMKNFDKLGEVTRTLLETGPISIESYDDKTFWLAVRFFKDFVKTKGFFSTLAFGFAFLPEVLMTIKGGVPKLILLAEFAGTNEDEIDVQARSAYTRMQRFGLRMRVTKSEDEAEKYWTMRRDSFALLRKHVTGKRTAPFIDDVIVRSEFLSDFLPKLNALVAQYPNLTYTIAGHAENGNFHIIPLVDPNDPKLLETVLTLSEKVYDLVLSYGGSIDAEHNDGIIRTPFLRQMYGDFVYALFQKTKNIFDPNLIFNPKKKVGGTKDDIATYLAKPHPDVAHAS